MGQHFRVKKDDKGNPVIIGTNGTRIVVTSPIEKESDVIAARAASMLDAHARREDLDLGRSNSYSHSTKEGEIGGHHIKRRQELLALAHAAETQAERWENYGKQLLDVATPPGLVSIHAIGKDGAVRSGWSEAGPAGALRMPESISEAIRLAVGYAAANMEAYLKITNQARDLLRDRYAAEFDAMHEQAAGQMADELGES
jgi:hypothetical protein